MEAQTRANLDEPVAETRGENDGDKTPTAAEHKSKKPRADRQSSWRGSASNTQDKVFAKYVGSGYSGLSAN